MLLIFLFLQVKLPKGRTMLKNINPLLNADILYALAAMGHGDKITITDSNFPATSTASQTIIGDVLQMAVDLPTALEAILSVFPIDTFDIENASVRGMQPVDDPDEFPPAMQDCAPLIEAQNFKIELVDRFGFYDLANESFAIIRTTEARPYGNLILRKGVVL